MLRATGLSIGLTVIGSGAEAPTPNRLQEALLSGTSGEYTNSCVVYLVIVHSDPGPCSLTSSSIGAKGLIERMKTNADNGPLKAHIDAGTACLKTSAKDVSYP